MRRLSSNSLHSNITAKWGGIRPIVGESVIVQHNQSRSIVDGVIAEVYDDTVSVDVDCNSERPDRLEFLPDIQTIGSVKPTATIADIAEEVGMYSASPAFVQTHGGPITRGILDAIGDDFSRIAENMGLFINIDVRIHRLYPGDFPAVPGWHCDGEYRSGYNGVPELFVNPSHHHIICTVSTGDDGVSTTEVVNEPFVIDHPSIHDGLWKYVHNKVESSNVSRISLSDGQLTKMGDTTLHRACAAKVRGWRLFFRASMWHKPYLNADEGCFSRQEHVYRLSEDTGW